MFRMITREDEMACWWWYNWYITHSTATFETSIVSSREYSRRVETIRQSYPWIIMLDEGVPVGYAYLSAFNPREAYIHTADLAIYLAPDKLHMGYGTRLMKEILRIAELDGYHTIVSLVTDGNTASEKLHEKAGFAKAATFPGVGYKNGTWLGVSYYVKVLRTPKEGKVPALPQNIDPYAEKRKRVPF